MGYNRSSESDILLLDISKNDEYVWTTNFDPSVPLIVSSDPSNPSNPSGSPVPKQNSSSISSNNSTIIVIGAAIGSLIGVIVLSVGGFILYKQHKNRDAMQNHGREGIERDDYNYEKSPGSENTTTNHGPILYGNMTTNHEPILYGNMTTNHDLR
jgi:hypothetical protein